LDRPYQSDRVHARPKGDALSNAARCRKYRENRHARDMVRDMLRDMLPEIIQLVSDEVTTRLRHDMGAPMSPTLRRVLVRSKKEATNKGERLSPTWSPSDEQRQFAVNLGIDPDLTSEIFRNYWLAKSGRDATKVDWNLTWRNWCLNDKGAKTRIPREKPNGHATAYAPLRDPTEIWQEMQTKERQRR